MTDLLLPAELRSKLIAYLASACAHRPFGEVQGIVSELAALPQTPEPASATEKAPVTG